MTDAADPDAPSEPFDEALYKGLGGANPMGVALKDEQAMMLDMPGPEDPQAAPPFFEERRQEVLALLEKGRDIRLYAKLAESASRLDGPKGLHAGLHLFDAVTRGFWDEINPAPPEDRLARRARQRVFAPFRERKLASLFDSVVVFDAGGFDREITLRAFYLATERHLHTKRRPPKDGESTYDAASLGEVVARVKAEPKVAELRNALQGAAAALKRLEAFLAGMPDYQTVRFADLIAELGVYADALKPFAAAPEPEAEAAAEEGAAPAPGAAPSEAAPAGPAPGQIGSRAEATALLDDLLAYYAGAARSSPVALALLKIRAMLDASFSDWLTEVAASWPDSVSLSLSGVEASELDNYRVEAETGGAAGAGPDPAAEAHAALEAGLAALAERVGEAEAALAALQAHEAAAEAAPDEIAALAAAVEAVRGAIPEAPPAPEPSALAPSSRPTGSIRDRNQVRQALQRLSVYFRTAEPSNPAHICFERLIDLVDRSFLDILKRVAPEDARYPALRLAQKESGS